MELAGVYVVTDEFSSKPKVKVFKYYQAWYEPNFVGQRHAKELFLQAIKAVKEIRK